MEAAPRLLQQCEISGGIFEEQQECQEREAHKGQVLYEQVQTTSLRGPGNLLTLLVTFLNIQVSFNDSTLLKYFWTVQGSWALAANKGVRGDLDGKGVSRLGKYFIYKFQIVFPFDIAYNNIFILKT